MSFSVMGNVFGLMASSLDIFQVNAKKRTNKHIQEALNIAQSNSRSSKHIQEALNIAHNSSFDLDRRAFHEDYIKLMGDFDKSVNKVLYDKKVS